MLDGQGRRAEADALLEGLESAMLRHLVADHRWLKQLRGYLDGR